MAFGVLIVICSLFAAIGWQYARFSLQTMPGLQLGELLCAVGLLICGVAIIARSWAQPRLFAVLVFALACTGALILLQSWFEVGLLPNTLEETPGVKRFIESTGVVYVILSCTLILMQYQSHKTMRIASRILPTIAVPISIIGMFGMLYFNLDIAFVQPLVVSLLFRAGLALTALYIVCITNQSLINRLYVGKLGILTIIVLLVVQIVTFSAWRQAERNNNLESSAAIDNEVHKFHDKFEQTITAYVSALQGFKGLYAASEAVDQNEFQNFYDSLDDIRTFSGLRNITYVQIVQSKDLSKFAQNQKADDSLGIQANKNFSYKNLSNNQTHYIVSYLASAAQSTSVGLDLSSESDRKQVFDTVLTTNMPQASQSVVFNANNLIGSEKGFFIVMPVILKNTITPVGFANASFGYQRLFDQIDKDMEQTGISYIIRDTAGIEIYNNGSKSSSNSEAATTMQVTKSTLPVLSTSFELSIITPSNFGITATKHAPLYTFLIGQLFSVILLIAFLVQSTTLRRAVDYAKLIRKDQLQLQSSINSLRVGYILTESTGTIVIINAMAEKMLHMQQNTQHIESIKDKQLLPAILSLIKKSERAGKHMRQTNLQVGSKSYAIDVNPVFDDNHTQIGSVTLIEDITESVVIARSRDEFFSIASHELRTPLTAIRGNTTMIQDYYGDQIHDADFRQMIADIHESSVRLIDIVNDFLDASRLEQNKIQLSMEVFDINHILESVIHEMAATAAEKHNRLGSDTTTLHLPEIYADRNRVKQIVYNLVGNAMKFTESGTITLSAAVIDSKIKISVTDSGPGISEVNQKLLFHKFQQANDNLLTREGSRGTGLGLYISKLLCEKMGGNLSLDQSKLGVGSTFSFSVPIATALHKKPGSTTNLTK